MLEFSETSQVVTLETPSVQQSRKRACSRDSQDVVQRAQRHCGRCGETGHNARTCSFIEEETSDSDEST